MMIFLDYYDDGFYALILYVWFIFSYGDLMVFYDVLTLSHNYIGYIGDYDVFGCCDYLQL